MLAYVQASGASEHLDRPQDASRETRDMVVKAAFSVENVCSSWIPNSCFGQLTSSCNSSPRDLTPSTGHHGYCRLLLQLLLGLTHTQMIIIVYIIYNDIYNDIYEIKYTGSRYKYINELFKK